MTFCAKKIIVMYNTPQKFEWFYLSTSKWKWNYILHKNQSLGVWSVGLTRAIYEYDDDQFDKEFIAREERELLEKNAGLDASDQMAHLEEQAIQNRINAEVNDLSAIPEEDNDDRDAIDYM